MFYNKQSFYNYTKGIHRYAMLLIVSMVLYSCKTTHKTVQTVNEKERITKHKRDKHISNIIKNGDSIFHLGADYFDGYSKLLQDRSVGIVTNQTGILSDNIHLVDFLMSKNVNLKKIYA